VIIQIF